MSHVSAQGRFVSQQPIVEDPCPHLADSNNPRRSPYSPLISEEPLIERGRQGYSVPGTTFAWQNGNDDASLGLFLSNHPSH